MLPLSWYAQRVYGSHATIVHLCSDARTGWKLHNVRASLVAGLAKGMGRSVLMVAETGHDYAIDYQDILRSYRVADELQQRVSPWIAQEMAAAHTETRHQVSGTQQQSWQLNWSLSD